MRAHREDVTISELTGLHVEHSTAAGLGGWVAASSHRAFKRARERRPQPGTASAWVVSPPGDDALEDTCYLVRLSVPRAGDWRAWGTVRNEFERQLAEQESAAAALHIDSEVRRGRDYVRVVIVATVDAADVAEALDLAWWTFRKAAGEDLAGWDLASAAAEVQPEAC